MMIELRTHPEIVDGIYKKFRNEAQFAADILRNEKYRVGNKVEDNILDYGGPWVNIYSVEGALGGIRHFVEEHIAMLYLNAGHDYEIISCTEDPGVWLKIHGIKIFLEDVDRERLVSFFGLIEGFRQEGKGCAYGKNSPSRSGRNTKNRKRG